MTPDQTWLSDLAARHLGQVFVEHEPGVFIVFWSAPQRIDAPLRLPVPEYLVTRRNDRDLEETFQRVLRSLWPEPVRNPVPEAEQCGRKLACGSTCCLRAQHGGACECGGDYPGDPGSCPA